MANDPVRFLIRMEGDRKARSAILRKRGAILDGLAAAGEKIGPMVVSDIRATFGAAWGLQLRSGALSQSIGSEVQKRRSSVRVYIGSRGKIPYAAILEFGKTTKPHEIRPARTKALRWRMSGSELPGVISRLFSRTAGGGEEQFASIVKHPGSRISARRYLRGGAIRNRGAIIDLFLGAVRTALRS